MLRKSIVAGTICLLAGCGGGGGGDNSSSGPPTPPSSTIPASVAQFSGTLVNASAVGIGGVKVSIPTRTGAYSTTTDSLGRYTLPVNIADFASGGVLAVQAYKDGTLPETFYYKLPLQGGASYDLGPVPKEIKPLKPNEYTSENFVALIHLGDDKYSGAQNSQLQTSSLGEGWVSTIFSWNSADNGKFKTARVTMRIRGMQGNKNTTKGIVALLDSAGGYIGSPRSLDMASDESGGYTQFTFDFALPATVVSGPIKMAVKTGAEPGDLDDIEYTAVSLQLL